MLSFLICFVPYVEADLPLPRYRYVFYTFYVGNLFMYLSRSRDFRQIDTAQKTEPIGVVPSTSQETKSSAFLDNAYSQIYSMMPSVFTLVLTC